ncbi:MAG: ABC transporter permease [Candidatus Sumerlaeia bacterium]|nr:ABC transporter permease [Candidatus Sumerlaeia bacterium]
MIAPRLVPLVMKYIIRHRVRSTLTVSGIAMAMFLFCAVQAMKSGVTQATEETAKDTTLVVYRENRFCPFTSELPENYTSAIEEIPGVVSVSPMKIVVNNCRAALDVVTFRGVVESALRKEEFTLRSGTEESWLKRRDSALLGYRLAERRGLNVGDTLDAAGIQVYVAGILDSENPQDQNVAYVHLDFLQRAAGNKQGIVTQFNVRVAEPSDLERVAQAIDERFSKDQAPTWTSSEKAFVARAAADIIHLVEFAGWLGIGSLVAIFALVANAITLSVQDRLRDHAVMQTLGFEEHLIVRLIVLESLLLSISGGTLGIALAVGTSLLGQFTFTVEGLSVVVQTTMGTVGMGLGICLIIGMGAGLVPAFRAAQLSTAEAFRMV